MGKTTSAAVVLMLLWLAALAVHQQAAPIVDTRGQSGAAAATLAPVPSAAAQFKAENTIKGIFSDEYAKNGNAARLALAVKLVTQGQQTDADLALRFVLFREARDLAAGVGNTTVAFQAVDEMAKGFAIDAIDLKTAAFVTASLRARQDDFLAVVDAGMELLDQAAAADHFTATARLGPVLQSAAAKTKEIPLLARVQARNREVAEQRREFDKQKATFDALNRNPADPDANLAVGRYFCFVKGSWDTGLPMLAKGSDAALKDFARKDLSDPSDAKIQLQLADGWWDLAEKESGAVKSQVERHATAWYRRALPNLAGADLARVEARLPNEPVPPPKVAAASPATVPTTPPKVAPSPPAAASKEIEPPSHLNAEGHRVLDLMPLIDADRGREDGHEFKRIGAELTGSGMLAIPYEPPQEYDFVVELTSGASNGAFNLDQFVTHGGHQFSWEMRSEKVGTRFGLLGVQGKNEQDTKRPIDVTKPGIVQGNTRHTSLIRVRNNGISASFDGEVLTQFATDFSYVEPPPNRHRIYNGGLGFGATNRYTFHKIELVEISGKGHFIPLPPDDPQMVRSYAAPLERPAGHPRLFLTPDGRNVVKIQENLTVWNRATGTTVLVLPGPGGVLSPDGRYVAGGNENGACKIIDLANPQRAVVLQGAAFHPKAFCADTMHLASSSPDELVVWGCSIGKRFQQVDLPKAAHHDVIFSPNGQRLLVWDTSAGISLYDSRNLAKLWSVGKQPYFLHGGPGRVSFSRDGTRIVASSIQDFHVLNATDGKVVASCHGHGNYADPKFSPDGHLIVASFDGVPIAVYDAQTGDELERFKNATALPVVSADWSPDGKRILAGCMTGVMLLFDTETGKVLQTFTGNVGLVWAVAFSADGKFVASSCNDNKVRVFKVVAP